MNAERGDVEPDFYELDDADRAAIERGLADHAAGRWVSNEVVIEWLKTWGTGKTGPCPREWQK